MSAQTTPMLPKLPILSTITTVNMLCSLRSGPQHPSNAIEWQSAGYAVGAMDLDRWIAPDELLPNETHAYLCL